MEAQQLYACRARSELRIPLDFPRSHLSYNRLDSQQTDRNRKKTDTTSIGSNECRRHIGRSGQLVGRLAPPSTLKRHRILPYIASFWLSSAVLQISPLNDGVFRSEPLRSAPQSTTARLDVATFGQGRLPGVSNARSISRASMGSARAGRPFRSTATIAMWHVRCEDGVLVNTPLTGYTRRLAGGRTPS
jgi:hypothetical protein